MIAVKSVIYVAMQWRSRPAEHIFLQTEVRRIKDVEYQTLEDRFMRKFIVAACLGTAFVPAIASANYKRLYCNGEEYVGNLGDKRPHLHCTKDFMAFKYADGTHKNLAPNSIPRDKKCNATDDLLANPEWNNANTTNPGAITAALQAFHTAGCE